MAAEPDHYDNTADDPLENSELARRLRRMTWPPAPPEVKERVLERIVERSGGKQAPGVEPPQAPDRLK